MWKLILKYQQFFPILEEMLIHYLYKNQEDEEMEQQIFQNFKEATEQPDLAQPVILYL